MTIGSQITARMRELVSDEHFSVDGTLLEVSTESTETWASHKSFRATEDHDDGNGDDFRSQKRSNDTHASTTDSDARLIRKGKGKEAKLSYLANTLMENRHGLIIGVDVRHASGTGVRDGVLNLLAAVGVKQGATLGADKGYDTQDFVAAPTTWRIAPHVARNTANGRSSAVPASVARMRGYAISQKVRKRIEQPFGWTKTMGGLRKLPLMGLAAVRGWVTWRSPHTT